MTNDIELLEEAKKVITKNKNLSISFLQRELQIGYNRAANLQDILQQHYKRRANRLGMRFYSKHPKRFRKIK